MTASCLASQGGHVICVEEDLEKLALLQSGQVPFFEPGLEQCVVEGLANKRLSFTSNMAEALAHGPIVFVCVGTPEEEDGSADLSQIEKVAVDIASHLSEYRLIVEKSTVPIQTHDRIRRTIRRHTVQGAEFEVACNPEFLSEGNAIQEFFNPSRIVLGVESERGKQLLLELYSSFTCPKVITDPGTAELVKHASNAFLAMKISYANFLSDICEALGADSGALLEGVGHDPRIGRAFLNPGVGFGGSCLPKDIRAFGHLAGKAGIDISILKAVEEINLLRPAQLVEKVRQVLWILKDKRVAVWGLSFKPDTDDIRNAASIEVVSSLLSAGASVTCYDPIAMSSFQKLFPPDTRISYATDPYSAVEGSHALVLLTEWEQFRQANMARVHEQMAFPIIIDGRGMFDPLALKDLGFEWYAFAVGTEAHTEPLGKRSPTSLRGALG